MIVTKEKRDEVFTLTDSQHNKLIHITYDTAEIHLGDNKKELVLARLSKMMRQRNIKKIEG